VIAPPLALKVKQILEGKILASLFLKGGFDRFPSDRFSVTISKELTADPLCPLLIEALKTILYKREGKLPAFILHY
jgi:hypothetical protein